MKIDFSLSHQHWADQVRLMLRQLPVDATEFVTDQMRFLMEKIIDFTPPKSKMQGTVRVRADISKAVRPFNVTAFRDNRLEKIFATQNHAGFMAAANNFRGPLKGAFSAPWSESLHTSQRGSRGRVGAGNKGKLFVLGRTDVAALKAYSKRKVDNVGMACAGWLRALTIVGGTMPKWIARHGQEFGSVVDGRTDPGYPKITAINSTPFASQHDEGSRIIRNALDSRVNAMRTDLRKRLQRLRDSAGLRAA